MHQKAQFGDNRTGVSANPELAQEMTEGMEAFPPTSVEDETELAAEMKLYVEASEGLGGVPMPKQPLPNVDEDAAAFFLDKLGERMAFERGGVRLYDAMIAKLDAHGDFPGGPDRADLEHLRDEELEHFQALEESMLELGGDPTALTPSADAASVIASGVEKVLSDPRINVLGSLEAILVAELADNECWDGLIELARGVGLDAMAERFEEYAEQERDHLTRVRAWIAAAYGRTTPTDSQ